MPSIHEEEATAVERTSRHLRETSQGRGQSVSPDRTVSAAHQLRHVRRLATPVGPRAKPRQPGQPPPVELLSPRPVSYHEAASYFEKHLEGADDIITDLETIALTASPDTNKTPHVLEAKRQEILDHSVSASVREFTLQI
jgi:hypothetical protein